MQTNQQSAGARLAVVRAIPMTGHKRRWCGLERWIEDRSARPNPKEKHGLPWPDFDVKVVIVDEPTPFDPNANGGVPVEISPGTLAALEKDHRIAVRVLNGDGGDPAEVIRVKAKASELEDKLTEARKESAAIAEQLKSLKSVSEQQVADQAARLAVLEQELAAARAQLGAGRKK